MKIFNRRNTHGLVRELVQHAHSRASHALTRTLTVTSTQLQQRCAKRQLSIYRKRM